MIPGQPLGDIVVVDLSRAVAGPHAAQMLGDMGARVIKVESPVGDDSRRWGPPFVGDESTYFLSVNRNKESIVVDAKSEAGSTTLRRLIESADVLIENFRPGTLARMGFPDDELHRISPGLVVLSISGFGHDGPEGGRAGYDQIAQGEAGMMSVTGSGPGDPERVGVPISDVLSGMYGAFGVMAALRERDATGAGSIIRTSLLAAVVGAHTYQGTAYTVAGVVGEPRGNHHPSLAPYGLFHAADGPAQIAVGTEGHWRSLVQILNLAPDERFDTNAGRVTHRDDMITVIEAALAEITTDDFLAQCDAAGIPAGRVRNIGQVYDWEQTRSQGLVIEVEHATLGTIEIPGPPLRWFHGGAEVPRRTHTAPPTLGQHTHDIQSWLDSANED